MSVIEVRRDWSRINRPKLNRFLQNRYYGPWPRVLIWVAALAALSAGMILADHLRPGRFHGKDWLEALFPLYLVFGAVIFLNGYWRKRLYRELEKAPLRIENRSVYLSENGISDFGPPRENALPWRYVTDVVTYNDLVLVLLSPVEYIPLQLDGLPAGMSCEDLIRQIEAWRKADGPPPALGQFSPAPVQPGERNSP